MLAGGARLPFITGKCSILPSVPYLFFYNPLIRIFKTLYIYPRTVRTYKYKGCSMSFLKGYSMIIKDGIIVL